MPFAPSSEHCLNRMGFGGCAWCLVLCRSSTVPSWGLEEHYTLAEFGSSALVSNSVLVTTSKAPVTSSDALVTTSKHCYY